MLEHFFKLSEKGTSIRTEVLAGCTTFMTMAYILVVNPAILSEAGMDFGAVVTATALSSAVATLVMALYARLPFALAPGMGLNAFFAYTVVLSMGYSWEFALTAVFLEGILFIILTFLNVRVYLINSIPANLKHAVSCGIGLFIAFIGLVNSGVVQTGMVPVGDGQLSGTIVKLGDIAQDGVLIALFGIVVTGTLLVRKVRGALLIGILAGTALGVPLGVTHLPEGLKFISLPPSLEPIAFRLDFSQVFSLDMLVVLFTFLFVDLFDTLGTLIGVADKADMIDEQGRIPRVKEALFADALGTTVGAVLGTSTVTTYVESAAGVSEGGRTGLTSLTVSVLFVLSLFLSPLFILIPASATAPALVLVGLFMMSPIQKVDLSDYTEGIPVFLTVIMMPLTYSIAEGIVFGLLSFVVLKVLSGRAKEVSGILYVLSVFFVLRMVL